MGGMSYAKHYLGIIGPCSDRYNCFRFRGGPRAEGAS